MFLRRLKWTSKSNHKICQRSQSRWYLKSCSASGMMQQKRCSASDLWRARTCGWLRPRFRREGQGDDICQLSISSCTEGTRGWWGHKDDGDTVSFAVTFLQASHPSMLLHRHHHSHHSGLRDVSCIMQQCTVSRPHRQTGVSLYSICVSLRAPGLAADKLQAAQTVSLLFTELSFTGPAAAFSQTTARNFTFLFLFSLASLQGR